MRKAQKRSTELTRREAIEFAAGLVISAGALMHSPSRARGADQNVVSVGTWGGLYTESQKAAYLDPFQEVSGVRVNIVQTDQISAAAIKAMVATGNYEYDVATVTSNDYWPAVRNGWLEPVDYSIVKSEDKTPSQLLKFGVGCEVISDIFAYRTDVFPNGGPESWADYWNVKKFPGPRAMQKRPSPIVEAALLVDGVSPDKLYPLDLDRAFRKMDEIKDAIRVWWISSSQQQQAAANKEAVIIQMYNARAVDSMKKGVPLKLVWNQGFYDPGYFVVPKGSPNAKNAMRLINYAAGPKGLAEFARRTYYGPSNLKSIELLDDETKRLMNTSPQNLAVQLPRNGEWWGNNMLKVTERFDQWLTS